MKTLFYFIMTVLLVTLTLNVTAEMALAADIMPASGNVKELLNNDRVRVVEAVRPPRHESAYAYTSTLPCIFF